MLLSLKHGVDYIKNNNKKNGGEMLCLKLHIFKLNTSETMVQTVY